MSELAFPMEFSLQTWSLKLCSLGLAHIRKKARVGRAALNKVLAGFVQAELAVYRHVRLAGVLILLAVVLPPADWTKRQGGGRFQRSVTTARTAIVNVQDIPRVV
jgi:hypothetical protein